MRKLLIIIFMITLSVTARAEDEISAKSFCLMNAKTGEIIAAKNEKEYRSPASTTKIITAILAIEHCAPNDEAEVSFNAQEQEGSSIYLRTGERITVNDLLYGMMLNSGNDAACAIAEHISKSVADFSGLMTKKAHEIGAKRTSFKNASGLDEEGHYTTAEDLAKIAAYALKNDTFREIVSTKNKVINAGGAVCYLKNHNKLLWNYDGCIGVKTGYTKEAGRCLVSAAKRNETELICVTLDAPNDWNDHKILFDMGFEKSKPYRIFKKGEILKEAGRGKNKTGAAVSEDVWIYGATPPKVKAITHTVKVFRRDVRKGEKIGYIEVITNGTKVGEYDLVAKEDISVPFFSKRGDFFSFLGKIIKIMLRNR